MPPKRSATVPPAAPVSPVEPDDRSDSHDDAEQPVITREEYNALVNSYQETLQRVQELEARNAAHAPSSQTSLEPEEQAPTPAPPEVPYRGFNPDPRVDAPPEFSGKISEFPNFMAACSVVFTLCPNTYSKPESKVLYVVSRLRGLAMNWARPIVENPHHPYRKDYSVFETAISNLYSDRNLQAKNEDKLARLEQTKSAATYAAEFQSLVDPLDLGDRAKCLLFYKGLKSDVKGHQCDCWTSLHLHGSLRPSNQHRPMQTPTHLGE